LILVDMKCIAYMFIVLLRKGGDIVLRGSMRYYDYCSLGGCWRYVLEVREYVVSV